nr:MAG TPA: hypothetical protein [Caudoviricetes sp.]
MLATVGEHDPEKIKAASFEVPDGARVDRVDVSKDPHTVVTSDTPISAQAKLEALIDENKATIKANQEAIAAQDKKLLDAINILMSGEE